MIFIREFPNLYGGFILKLLKNFFENKKKINYLSIFYEHWLKVCFLYT